MRRERRIAIYKAIADFWKEKGYPPSLDDVRIAAKVGSKTTVQSYVQELQELGYLTVAPGTYRSITLTDKTL